MYLDCNQNCENGSLSYGNLTHSCHGFFYLNSSDKSIFHLEEHQVSFFFYYNFLIEIPVFNAIRVISVARFTAFDVGLHCFLVSLILNAGQKLVNTLSHNAFSQSDQNLHLGAFWIANDAKVLHADNEGSDQTARMRRLI